MKKKIIALISGAVILIIATGSIYGKPESGHKEGEPDVVGTFSINQYAEYFTGSEGRTFAGSQHGDHVWRRFRDEF